MPRLFTALVPADGVLAHLAAALRPVRAGLPELRWEPVERWHVTLCFHGQAEVADVAAGLRDNVAGLAAPTLRLAGAGTFRNPSGGVVWVGVRGAEDPGGPEGPGPRGPEPVGGPAGELAGGGSRGGRESAAQGRDSNRLALLARASGADPARFRGHLTVARWTGGRGLVRRCQELAARLSCYSGPVWVADEVVVVRSELLPGGPRYTVVERVPLVGSAGSAR